MLQSSGVYLRENKGMTLQTTSVRKRRHPAVVLASAFLIAFARVALGFCPRGLVVIPSTSGPSRVLGSGGGPFQAARNTRTATEPGTVTVMAVSLDAPRFKAEKKAEHFSLNKSGIVKFGGSQQVEAPIPGASLASMKDYISDPSRLAYACWDHDLITPLGDGVFRMRFMGQSIFSISIDMSVDVKFSASPNGNIQCKSVGYSIDDMARILGQGLLDTFSFELEGELRAQETETKVRSLTLKNTLLSGEVGITISAKIPSLLVATPERLVKAATLGINNRVLQYVASTFVGTVAGDYRRWTRDLKL